MNLEEVRAWLEANRNDSEVSAYLGELSTPTVEGVEGFLDTDAGRKLLQPRLDSNFTKGLNTWKDKNLDKLIEEEVKKRNPDETEEQKRIRALEEKLEQKERESTREKLRNKAITHATEKQLPSDLIDFFIGDDEDSTTENLGKFETTFTAAVQKAVESRFKDNGRDIPSGNQGTATKTESFADLAQKNNIRNQ